MTKLTFSDFRRYCDILTAKYSYRPPIIIASRLPYVINTKGSFNSSAYWFINIHSLVFHNDNVAHWS